MMQPADIRLFLVLYAAHQGDGALMDKVLTMAPPEEHARMHKMLNGLEGDFGTPYGIYETLDRVVADLLGVAGGAPALESIDGS